MEFLAEKFLISKEEMYLLNLIVKVIEERKGSTQVGHYRGNNRFFISNATLTYYLDLQRFHRHRHWGHPGNH